MNNILKRLLLLTTIACTVPVCAAENNIFARAKKNFAIKGNFTIRGQEVSISTPLILAGCTLIAANGTDENSLYRNIGGGLMLTGLAFNITDIIYSDSDKKALNGALTNTGAFIVGSALGFFIGNYNKERSQ